MRSLIHLGLTGCALALATPALATSAFDDASPTPAHASRETVPDYSARGVLRAGEMADISAGMSGRLLKAGFKPGSAFNKGDILARFDCKRQHAQLEALTQAHETLVLKHDNVRELFTAGAAGALELNIARSEMQQAKAERDALKASIKDCTIYAPYGGLVIARHVSAFETPQAGAPLYSIIRSGALEISVIAPSRWMRWLRPDQDFIFSVDETGEEFKGRIVRMGAAVDPVSQTIEITAHPKGKTGSALAGMSGIALFEPDPTKESIR